MFLRVVEPGNPGSRDLVIRKPIVSVGRAPGNDLALPDASIAPTHCNILRKPGFLTISVLERTAEILVNGRRARKADLRPGDRVGIGRFELTVHDGEPEAASNPERMDPEAQLEAVQRLVQFSERLMADNGPEQLFVELLQAVVELTSAEKGFVIVLQGEERHLAASHNVGTETLDLSRVSDSIVDSVLRTRKPLIVSNALHDDRFRTARSVVDLRLSSVMCVPLAYRNTLLGVIYLGNDSVTDQFDSGKLAILSLFTAQASLLVHTALALNELKLTNRNLRDQLRSASQGEIIGSSVPMKALFKILRRVAPTDLTVLVLGETGTGKELVARELHRLSDRGNEKFISINCGAIPENLLESELFGHKKGSFTGATQDKQGKFLVADKGTLFLDEVGEMPMSLQVKLLRVLQERVVERVGDYEGRPVDIRVVAATNKNLEDEVREGRFREDLFYRLNEVSLTLPPLRDRGDDVVELAWFFLNKYAAQYEAPVRGFNPAAVLAMKAHYWPGNVRQLENRVKRAVIMADHANLTPEDLGIQAADRKPVVPLDRAVEDFKTRYIREVLEMNGWNKAQTARDLDVDPRTIFRFIERMDE